MKTIILGEASVLTKALKKKKKIVRYFLQEKLII